MGGNSERTRENERTRAKQDLVSTLFSAGLTILGIGFPVVVGTLIFLRDPAISTYLADQLKWLAWLMLPVVVICAIQAIVCLSTLVHVILNPRWAVIMTYILIVYMLFGVLAWSLTSLLN